MENKEEIKDKEEKEENTKDLPIEPVEDEE